LRRGELIDDRNRSVISAALARASELPHAISRRFPRMQKGGDWVACKRCLDARKANGSPAGLMRHRKRIKRTPFQQSFRHLHKVGSN
jgi:hypothetical protein